MIRNLFLGMATLAFLALGACYPYQEKPKQKPQQGAQQAEKPKQTKKLTEDEARKKAEDEVKKKSEENTTPSTTPGGDAATTNPDGGGATLPPAEPKRQDYAFATKVPGKEGFVFSPYNNKVVDVKDLPSGTLVADPTYPASEKKYFRVP
jgi:hypothetical protein